MKNSRIIAKHSNRTLDDRIELNRQRNETLETMARTLFKSWFVDFDPIRAKMTGLWHRNKSLPGMPAHLYDLFPNRLVQSGEIPEGWSIQTIDQISQKVGMGPFGSNIMVSTFVVFVALGRSYLGQAVMRSRANLYRVCIRSSPRGRVRCYLSDLAPLECYQS